MTMEVRSRWRFGSRLTAAGKKSPTHIPLHALQLVLLTLVSPFRILAVLWRKYRAEKLDSPSLHFAAEPSPFMTYVGKADGSEEIRTVTIRDFITMKCPSLRLGFRPSRLLSNGHAQTVYGVFGDFSKVDLVTYERKLLRLKDGGTISLDFTPSNDERTLPDDTPIIVVLHGMTGGSHERYVRSIVAPACAPVEQGGLGYRAVVINFRGCAGTPITSETFYHPGVTNDTRQALMYISRCYPRARLIGIGFSLGANVLVRYLAQEGENSRLSAGCAVGCPWDLGSCSAKLSNGTWMDRVYGRTLAANLQTLVTRNADALSVNPGFASARAFITGLKSPSLRAFDVAFSIKYADYTAPFPFKDVDEYYRWASSHNVLGDVRVPLLAINADDDPIVPTIPWDVGGNGNVALAVTRGGGHLGWFEDGQRWWRGEQTQWIKKPVLQWLRAVGDDLVDRPRGKPLREVDDFIMEHDRDDIGCYELRSAEKVGSTFSAKGMFAGL